MEKEDRKERKQGIRKKRLIKGRKNYRLRERLKNIKKTLNIKENLQK